MAQNETPHDDTLKEACGIFGVFNHDNAVELTYYGLYSLQHRGQESAGIACVMDNRIKSYLGMGLVGDVFKDEFFSNPDARQPRTKDFLNKILQH